MDSLVLLLSHASAVDAKHDDIALFFSASLQQETDSFIEQKKEWRYKNY